jgi:hypothetical protein
MGIPIVPWQQNPFDSLPKYNTPPLLDTPGSPFSSLGNVLIPERSLSLMELVAQGMLDKQATNTAFEMINKGLSKENTMPQVPLYSEQFNTARQQLLEENKQQPATELGTSMGTGQPRFSENPYGGLGNLEEIFAPVYQEFSSAAPTLETIRNRQKQLSASLLDLPTPEWNPLALLEAPDRKEYDDIKFQLLKENLPEQVTENERSSKMLQAVLQGFAQGAQGHMTVADMILGLGAGGMSARRGEEERLRQLDEAYRQEMFQRGIKAEQLDLDYEQDKGIIDRFNIGTQATNQQQINETLWRKRLAQHEALRMDAEADTGYLEGLFKDELARDETDFYNRSAEAMSAQNIYQQKARMVSDIVQQNLQMHKLALSGKSGGSMLDPVERAKRARQLNQEYGNIPGAGNLYLQMMQESLMVGDVETAKDVLKPILVNEVLAKGTNNFIDPETARSMQRGAAISFLESKGIVFPTSIEGDQVRDAAVAALFNRNRQELDKLRITVAGGAEELIQDFQDSYSSYYKNALFAAIENPAVFANLVNNTDNPIVRNALTLYMGATGQEFMTPGPVQPMEQPEENVIPQALLDTLPPSEPWRYLQ